MYLYPVLAIIYILMRGVILLSIFSKKIKRKPNAFTLMIVPEKYGKVKSIMFEKKTIAYIFVIFLLILLLAYRLFISYLIIREDNQTNLEYIKELKKQTNSQQLRIDEYKINEDKLLEQLQEIEELHQQLQQRLENKNAQKTINLNKIVNKNFNLSDISANINIAYATILKYDLQVATEKQMPTLLPYPGRISSGFGYRTNPVSRSMGESHHGIDIVGPSKSKIVAAGDGIVEFAGWLNSYGNTVIIDHQNGYKSLYAHNSKLLVKKFQEITRGQAISLMGNSGRSTGTHVHFEVRFRGVPINPFKIKGR